MARNERLRHLALFLCAALLIMSALALSFWLIFNIVNLEQP